MRKLRALWAGELPLGEAFWTWAIGIGLLVNLTTTVLFLALITYDRPWAALFVGHVLSVPYNVVALVGVWRSAARYQGRAGVADLARIVTVVAMLLLSLSLRLVSGLTRTLQETGASITSMKSGITNGAKPVGSRVTRKGQVTIPKRVRDHLGIEPGSVVDFELGADGRIVLIKAGAAPEPSRFERFRGIATTKLTTDEIMAMLRGDD